MHHECLRRLRFAYTRPSPREIDTRSPVLPRTSTGWLARQWGSGEMVSMATASDVEQGDAVRYGGDASIAPSLACRAHDPDLRTADEDGEELRSARYSSAPLRALLPERGTTWGNPPRVELALPVLIKVSVMQR